MAFVAVAIGVVIYFAAQVVPAATGIDASRYAPVGYQPPPLAAQASVTIDRAFINRLDVPQATVTVHNRSDRYLHIDVECVFRDRTGEITATGSDLVMNVAPGGSGWGNTRSYERGARFDTAECRVSHAMPSQ